MVFGLAIARYYYVRLTHGQDDITLPAREVPQHPHVLHHDIRRACLGLGRIQA